MKLDARYRDLPFTREQVDKLQQILGLQDHDVAVQLASLITVGLFQCAWVQQMQVPNIRAAKNRLGRIEGYARTLRNILNEHEPMALELIRSPNYVRDVEEGRDTVGTHARIEAEKRRMR